MKIATILPFLLLLVSLSACTVCDCDSTVAPVDHEYTGANGYVIRGGGLPKTVVNCAKSSVEFLDPRGLQRAIRLELGEIDGKEALLIVALPGSGTSLGRFSWVPRSQALLTNAYISIEQEDEVMYFSKSGVTTIDAFGGLGGLVSGTFAGVLEDADHNELEIDGRFNAVRVEHQ
jgi:hypothetical protein